MESVATARDCATRAAASLTYAHIALLCQILLPWKGCPPRRSGSWPSHASPVRSRTASSRRWWPSAWPRSSTPRPRGSRAMVSCAACCHPRARAALIGARVPDSFASADRMVVKSAVSGLLAFLVEAVRTELAGDMLGCATPRRGRSVPRASAAHSHSQSFHLIAACRPGGPLLPATRAAPRQLRLRGPGPSQGASRRAAGSGGRAPRGAARRGRPRGLQP